ncbi:MAG: flagella basal body P-ring formation protein FlgA [Planctomycetota bacterium]
MTPARAIPILLALTQLLAPGIAFGDSIVLRSAARVASGEPVLLEDVAVLNGDAALAVAYAQVSGPLSPGERVRFTTADVRSAIERHTTSDEPEPAANWSALALSGAECSVIAIDADLLRARAEARAKRRAGDEPRKAERVHGAGTLRAAIRGYLSRTLGVPETDLRLSFEERDAPLLATPTAGRAVEMRTVGDSRRIPVAVSVYDGDRIAAEGTVRVTVLVRRGTLVAREPIRRGGLATDDAFTRGEHWLPPDEIPVEIASDGLHPPTLRVGLDAGEVLLARHVHSPSAIERGDRVVVRCISRGVVVRIEAYALEDGRVGEQVRLRRVGSDRRDQGFTARVEGRGRATAATAAHLGSTQR